MLIPPRTVATAGLAPWLAARLCMTGFVTNRQSRPTKNALGAASRATLIASSAAC